VSPFYRKSRKCLFFYMGFFVDSIELTPFDNRKLILANFEEIRRIRLKVILLFVY